MAGAAPYPVENESTDYAEGLRQLVMELVGLEPRKLREQIRGRHTVTPPKLDDAAPAANLTDGTISLSTAIQQWVDEISEDIESSSPRAIRQHKLYHVIKGRPVEESLPGVLQSMEKKPLVAVLLAQDIVGNRASPIQDENDVGRLPVIVARWTQWGKDHHYLS